MKAAILMLVGVGCCTCWVSADDDMSSAPAAGAASYVRQRENSITSTHAHRREAVRRAVALRRQVHESLQQEARAKGTENLIAIEDLLDTYITLQLDDSLSDAHQRQLAATVRSRLIRIRDRLLKGSSEARPEKSVARPESSKGVAVEQPTDLTAPDRLVHRAARQAAETVAQVSHLVLAQQGIAGPAAPAAAGALAAAPQLAGDYGIDLADLIQTVISPDTWARNGGQGSIYYYRPLRVLVIRQTGEVHERIGGTIDDLRRAGN